MREQKSYNPYDGELISNNDPSNPTMRRGPDGTLISRDPAPRIDRSPTDREIKVNMRPDQVHSSDQHRDHTTHDATGQSHRILPGARTLSRYPGK